MGTISTPITPSPIRCAIPITTIMPLSSSSSTSSSSSSKLSLIPEPDPVPVMLAFDSTLEAHLRSLESQGKLVDILRSAWTMPNNTNNNNNVKNNNNNQTMKAYILHQVKDTSWMTVEDSDTKLLQYDWEIINELDEDGYGKKDNNTTDDDDEDPLLLKFASNQVRLGMASNYGRDDVDVSQICGGYYGVGYQGGSCPNYNPNCNGDEIYHFQMQINFHGTVRLRIHEYQTCTCSGSNNANANDDDFNGNNGDSDSSGSHKEIDDESNYYVAYQCNTGKLSSSSSLL